MIRHKISTVIWYLALVLLPFTSLPLAGKILHSQMVAAPIIILFSLLTLIWLIPYLISHNLDLAGYPLIIFSVYCLVVILLRYFFTIPIHKNISLVFINAEAIASLLIGVFLFLVPLHFVRSKKLLQRSIRFIYFGFVPMFAWSILQFLTDQLGYGYPVWMETLQSWISTSGALYPGRITGFAYEPSWVAHQLNLLYFPLLAGFSLSGASIFKSRVWNLTIENVFLLGSLLLLFLSKSRIGWLTLLACSLYAVIILTQRFLHRIRMRNSRLNQLKWKLLLPLGLVIMYAMVLLSGLFIASKIDSRMEQLFNPQIYQNRGILSIANEFLFAERILYWQAGWEMFNDHPIIGVGIGNYGFHFEDYMPSFAWALDEPRTIIFQAGYLANNKNLWTRLLSETGMIGFVLFISWLFLIGKTANSHQKINLQMEKTWIYITNFALIAVLMEGFSIDSFAMPYLWITLGLCMAAWRISDVSHAEAMTA